MSLRDHIIKALRKKYEADVEEAVATANIYLERPAGIGDHSTKDFWDNATEALKLLASADERLETLEKYFNTKEVL